MNRLPAPARQQRMFIVGNSVSSPPPGGASYPQRLEELLGTGWIVASIVKGGATLDEFVDEVVETMRQNRPDVLVLQVGINECAPRPLGRVGRARLGRLRPVWLRQRVIGFLHRYRPNVIRFRGVKQLTSASDFADSVRRVLGAARQHSCLALLLPITRIPAAAEARTPFTNREVARYNAVLASLANHDVRFVNEAELFGSTVPEEFCAGPETVHLAAAAHEQIARFLADWLDGARRNSGAAATGQTPQITADRQ